MKGLRDSPQASVSSPHDNGLDTPANRVPNELAQGERVRKRTPVGGEGESE